MLLLILPFHSQAVLNKKWVLQWSYLIYMDLNPSSTTYHLYYLSIICTTNVLISLGCYNEILPVLEAGQSKIKMLMKALFRVCKWMPSYYIFPWQREKECKGLLSVFLFIRPLTPYMRASPSWFNYLPKDPLPNTTQLGFRFQHVNFWGGTTNIQSIATNWP